MEGFHPGRAVDRPLPAGPHLWTCGRAEGGVGSAVGVDGSHEACSEERSVPAHMSNSPYGEIEIGEEEGMGMERGGKWRDLCGLIRMV